MAIGIEPASAGRASVAGRLETQLQVAKAVMQKSAVDPSIGRFRAKAAQEQREFGQRT